MMWTIKGVAFGVLSSFFVAMNAITVKKKYPLVDNNHWKITLYNNLNASFVFIPIIILAGEPRVIVTSANARTLYFWILMTIGGALGILISFATAAQIKYTSPLTHNVSATAKAAAQTAIALAVCRNPINALSLTSIGIVLFGSLCYAVVRRRETKKRQSEQDREETEEVAKPLTINVDGGGAGEEQKEG